MRGKEKLPAKEELFCHYYTRLGNAREAVVHAGYPAKTAEKHAARLLLKPQVQSEIERQAAADFRKRAAELAAQGLARLAFCPVNDAAGLLLREEVVDEQRLAELDLFCVSEMKQSKGGGVEIKFFDRLKALELLLRCGQEAGGGQQASSLYEALEKGAAVLSQAAGESHAL